MSKKLTNIFSTISLVFLNFSIPLIFWANFRPFYDFAFEKFEVFRFFSLFGISRDEALENFHQVLAYNTYMKSAISSSFFSNEDLIHMADVKMLFGALYVATIIAFLIVIIGYIYTKKVNLFKSSIISLMITAGLGLYNIIFSFDTFFTMFHKLAFRNFYWQLDPFNSNLIKYFPEKLFELQSIYIFISILAICVIELVLSYILLRKYLSRTNNSNKILITGGHLTPALAVLEELRKRGYSEFVWMGRKYSQEGDQRKSSEFKIVKEQGIRFYDLRTGRLQRKWTTKTLLIGLNQLILIPLGFLRALKIIKKENPEIIISFGGYIAVPVALVGKILGKKVVTHEQTAVTGLANRVIGKMADKVLISWDESFKHFSKKKTVKTGNPIRPEIFDVSTDQFNFNNDLPITYVTGGSQGSNTINWRLLEILPRILRHTNIIHQTGSSTVTKDYEKALKAKKRLPKKLHDNYLVKEHIYGKQIGEVFSKSSLVVSRSGANTITELLVLAKPSILIPIPWSSNNEQMLNAKILERIGLALIIEQSELTPDLLYEKMKTVLDNMKSNLAPNNESIQSVKQKSQGRGNENAASAIVDEIEKL